jgi:hypothetical protein
MGKVWRLFVVTVGAAVLAMPVSGALPYTSGANAAELGRHRGGLPLPVGC